jgi:acyl transferase domain-containing protein/acyl carrier protein
MEPAAKLPEERAGSRLDGEPSEPSGAIAVIGLTGRFPGARSIDELWQNLADGRECIHRFSDSEIAEAGIPAALRQAPNFVNARGVVADPEWFDAAFFGYTPKEAELTDPQQRIFLECAWEALEHAGYDPGRYAGLIGVYAGVDASNYAMANLMTAEDRLQGLIGNDKDYLATRVCFKLDLRGPGLTIQTACSTSLVAIQVACQGLLGYQCDMALAGGVGIGFPQRAGYLYQEGGILSPDGHCRTFDAQARGTVPSDGAGVVVLKRLADALADGDTIHAVIKGAAINNDGGTKVGFTAPGIAGQAGAIALAQAMAGCDPATIGYVEAHGTATEIGDPAEIAALTDVFRSGTDKKQFCAIGSIKSNVGHMNSAAGVGGLIKTILMLERRMLLPSLHYERPNPMIDFASSPFWVNTELREWPANGHPRRAGVSSFGVGGTNAHMVLEEAPAAAPSGSSRPHQLLVVSARTRTALDAASAQLADFLRRNPQTPLADVAYTLQCGRALHRFKRIAVAEEPLQAAKALEEGEVLAGEAREPSVVFLFPGQGAQHAGMARGIYQTEPEFRAVLDACADRLAPALGLDLRTLLLSADGAGGALDRTAVTQPALFAVEYALARLWMSWGVEPAAMIGHSVGEYVAACLAGALDLDDALTLVAARGRLIQSLPPGVMLSVAAGEADLPPLGEVALAAVNAPASVVLSGAPAAMAEMEAALQRRGLTATRLKTSHAFHSAMLEPILEPFLEQVRRIRLAPPRIPYLSSLTGTWIRAEEATDPRYWVEQMRRTVRFSAGVQELLHDGDRFFLEVGPGRALGSLVRRHGERLADRTLASLPHARDAEPDTRALATALGRLYGHHLRIDWQAYYRGERRRRIPLPTYPFERQRYWRPVGLAPIAAPLGGAAPDAGAAHAWAGNGGGIYFPTWKRALPPRPAPEARDEVWLVYGEASPFTSALVEGLERRGSRAIACAGVPDVVAELAAATPRPVRVACLVGLSPEAPPPEEGLFRLLALLRAIAAAGGTTTVPPEITVVTTGTADVGGEEEISPWNLTLLSPCQIAPQELTHLRCRLLDVAVAEVERHLDRTAREVVGDLCATDWPGWRMARRGAHRWTPAYERVLPADPPPLRERGVYLITGGLGRLGLTVAEHLARAARARLVLVSRRGLIARERWDDWLAAHPPEEPTRRAIEGVRRLEALGAEVLVVAADVADEPQMEHALAVARSRFGPLHGAVHAAGLAGRAAFRAIAETGPEHCEPHLRAKARGVEVLARLLGDDLDFCLLFSSLSTVLGGVGLMAYAAANQFLDGFAHRMSRERRSRWISVDWDAWQVGPEGGAGFAAGLSAAAGVDALQRILGLPRAERWVVSALDLGLRLAAPVQPERHGAAAAEGPAAPRHARPADLDSDYVAPRSALEEKLAQIWQELLGIEDIGVEDNFFRLGGDSLIAIQLGARLRSLLAVDLAVNELFDEPTIAGLARRIEAMKEAAQRELAGVESALAMIESLSDEDVQRMLAELEGQRTA